MALPTYAQVLEARDRIAGECIVTPLLFRDADPRSPLSCFARRPLLFKLENFQKTGSFKARGALNAVKVNQQLAPQLAQGTRATTCYVTHSTGNHGAALAWAASRIPNSRAKIVVPYNSTAIKKSTIEAYGGENLHCEPTLAAQEGAVQSLMLSYPSDMEQRCFVHPSEDPYVIAGQGTVGLEIMEQARQVLAENNRHERLAAIVVPIGGGGLISGIALAAKRLDPSIKIIGAEPANADDAFRSFQMGRLVGHRAGQPNTAAEGLHSTMGAVTWDIIRNNVDSIITVEEQAILRWTNVIMRDLKVVVEPAVGVAVAAVMSKDFSLAVPGNSPVAIVLCGGNIDLPTIAAAVACGPTENLMEPPVTMLQAQEVTEKLGQKRRKTAVPEWNRGYLKAIRLDASLPHTCTRIKRSNSGIQRQKTCIVCGRPASFECSLCNVALHFTKKNNQHSDSVLCWTKFHTDHVISV